jgi:hypothetical protein
MKTQTTIETMTGIMLNDAQLLGTSLRLAKGQTVTITPASNIPGSGKWYAALPEWTNGDSILIDRDDFIPTIETQLNELVPQWERLAASLIPEIGDDYRATDDPGDDVPGMCLTIGFTPADKDKDASWHYQTGDNSYSGGAYFHANWAVVYLYRDSVPSEMANDIADQLGECCL